MDEPIRYRRPCGGPRTGAGLRPSPRRVSTSGGNTTGRVMQIKLSEADRELMQGVIDMHLHAMPCLIDRPFSELDIAAQARDVGYRGLVLKSIYSPNADR